MPDIASVHIFNDIKKGGVPEDPYLYMPVPSNLDPGLSPDGKQLVIAGTPVAAGAKCWIADASGSAPSSRTWERLSCGRNGAHGPTAGRFLHAC